MSSFSTQCIHADGNLVRTSQLDGVTTALAPPISMTTTFASSDAHFKYSRMGQPTRTRCEIVLGALHDAHAVLYSSGSSSQYAALLHYAPSKVAIQGGYHGTHMVLDLLKRTGVVKQVVDLDEVDQLGKGDVVWLETPNNPSCKIYDIELYVALAREKGAVVIVDSTFAPPPLMDAFEFGVDMVMHSTTKYLAGHSDCLSGALFTKSSAVHEALLADRLVLGSVAGSMETWLLLRSVRTLKVRVMQQNASAAVLAEWLNSEDAKSRGVACVHHPSLSHHENHLVAKKQMKGGFGPMLSFECVSKEKAMSLPSKLCLFQDATSLGGVESLVEWRHQYDAAVSDRLLRVSVGLEDVEDLIEDIKQALASLS